MGRRSFPICFSSVLPVEGECRPLRQLLRPSFFAVFPIMATFLPVVSWRDIFFTIFVFQEKEEFVSMKNRMLSYWLVCLSVVVLCSCERRMVYLSTSFREPATDGLRFIYSHDGYHWDSVPGVWLRPQVGTQALLRDPSMIQAPDGTFHLVWTSSWGDDYGFGYASSRVTPSYAAAESRPTNPTATMAPSSPSVASKWVRIETSAASSVTPSATSAAGDPDGLAVGVRIRHDRFGEGQVSAISGEGDNRKITVDFDHVGQKHLLLKFAKFTILK